LVIRRIELDRFKCFERLDLPIERLTLLTGTNASGKSSIIQALVLLHQTMRDDEWSTSLLLNGVRRAVRDGVVPAHDVALHFFRGRHLGGAQVSSPRIDAKGNVDFWPEGFFDQFDKDTAALAGWDS
jgi:predicted ATPase